MGMTNRPLGPGVMSPIASAEAKSASCRMPRCVTSSLCSRGSGAEPPNVTSDTFRQVRNKLMRSIGLPEAPEQDDRQHAGSEHRAHRRDAEERHEHEGAER